MQAFDAAKFIEEVKRRYTGRYFSSPPGFPLWDFEFQVLFSRKKTRRNLNPESAREVCEKEEERNFNLFFYENFIGDFLKFARCSENLFNGGKFSEKNKYFFMGSDAKHLFLEINIASNLDAGHLFYFCMLSFFEKKYFFKLGCKASFSLFFRFCMSSFFEDKYFF